MSLLFRREKEVKRLLQEYFKVVDDAMDEFEATMRCFLDVGPCEQFVEGDRRLHKLESRADDLRHGIEKLLYERSLLPESRGDLLGLLEHFDKIPNLAETITFIIDTQRVEVPPAYKAQVVELLEINVESYRLVRHIVDHLFTKPEAVGDAVNPVDEKESEGDTVERDVIRAVFRDESVPEFQRIMLRDLVLRIGDISDSAENVARRLEIISLKRRI